ncbi:Hypothetical predicted protein, partial [Olea europaea subsp. europaea]
MTQERLTSRKITKFVTLADSKKSDRLGRSIEDFHRDYARNEPFFNPRLILNTVQTCIKYEIPPQRTITPVGMRDPTVMIRSKNKVRSSYTAQPTVSRDGRTVGKLLLILKENTEDGKFGQGVRKEVEELKRQHGNVRVIASKHGKTSNEIIDEWRSTILGPAIKSIKEGLDQDEKDLEELNAREYQQAGFNRTRTASTGIFGLDGQVGTLGFDADDRICYAQQMLTEAMNQCRVDLPSPDTVPRAEGEPVA